MLSFNLSKKTLLRSVSMLFLGVATSGIVYAQDLEWRDVYFEGFSSTDISSTKDAIYANGKYVAVGSSFSNYRVRVSNDGYTWSTPTIASGTAPSAIRLNAITYGGGVFVGVGDNTNNFSTQMVRSADGVSWTGENQASSGATDEFKDVTYGNSLFVAVGTTFFSTDRSIQTSPNGITWTVRGDVNNSLASVTYGAAASKFVAVGNNVIATSADGVTWATTTAPSSLNLLSIAYGNNLFVAIANGTSTYLTSSDGTIWTTRSYASFSGSKVDYLNSRFIVDGRWTSTDGINWSYSGATAMSNYTSAYTGLLHDGTHYIGMSPTAQKVARAGNLTVPKVSTPVVTNITSTTEATLGATYLTDGGSTTTARGLCWGTSPNPTTNCASSGTTTGVFTQEITGLPSKTLFYFRGYATNGSGTSYSADSSTTTYIGNVSSATVTGLESQASVDYTLPTGSVYGVVVLRSTSAVVAVPTDGAVYSVGNTIGASTVACVESNAALSSGACTAYGLTNGVSYHFKIFTRDKSGNYSTGLVPTGSPTVPAVTTILGTGINTATSTIIAPGASSTAAGVFTFKTTSGTDTITSVIVNLGSATAMSGVSLIEITSDNGATVYGSSTNPSNATTSIPLNINTLTANTTETQYKIRITPKNHANMPAVPGETYTIDAKIDSWTGTNTSKIASDTAGATLIIDNESPILETDIGVTWTSRTPAANLSWQSITFGNGLFVAVSSSGTGNRVMTSPDGITWTSRTSAADNAWQSVTYGNGLFVAVANTGTGNRVMTSPDGITWTSRTSAADNSWNSVTYGNGLFVAVSSSGTNNRVMTSPDGITWTIRTSAANNAWKAVTYGNGLFVAVACGINSTSCSTTLANRVMTSPDGITWTMRTSSSRIYWSGVVYGNDLFVAVGGDGGSSPPIMTSTDGISWSMSTLSYPLSDYTWQSVTYGNGLFVAVACGNSNGFCASGSSGETRLIYSIDGISWSSASLSLAGYSQWRSVTYGNDKFVAIAQAINGTSPFIATSNITTVSVVASDERADVSYVTPSDDDLHSALIFRSSAVITDTPTEGTSYSIGNTVGSSTVACIDTALTASSTSLCSVTGLTNGSPVHLKLFFRDSYGNYSPGVTPDGSPATATTSSVGVTQSGYLFRASSTTIMPGSSYASQNTAATLAGSDDAFRLRLTLHIATSTLNANGKFFKLQYAEKIGTCDTGFVGETYNDVTNSTPVAFYDTPGISNNTAIYNTADMTHGADSIINQSYIESNPLTNSQGVIAAGQDGKFEFSLFDNNAPANTSYCLRVVNINDTVLDAYEYIPEIAIAAQQIEQVSYRFRNDDGSASSATYAGAQNGSLSSTFVVGDKLRIRFLIKNTGSKRTTKSYQMEYATSTCTLWTQVPKAAEVTFHHWKMQESLYVDDNSITSDSSGITNPSASGFSYGKIRTVENTTGPVGLPANYITEIEYSIRSTPNIVPSDTYCFRLSAVGQDFFTYSAVPQLVPAALIFRYQGGGGGGVNATAAVEAPSSTATTTVTGGGADGSTTAPIEGSATPSSPTSTTTPSQGGGDGDVGYLWGRRGPVYVLEMKKFPDGKPTEVQRYIVEFIGFFGRLFIVSQKEERNGYELYSFRHLSLERGQELNIQGPIDT